MDPWLKKRLTNKEVITINAIDLLVVIGSMAMEYYTNEYHFGIILLAFHILVTQKLLIGDE